MVFILCLFSFLLMLKLLEAGVIYGVKFFKFCRLALYLGYLNPYGHRSFKSDSSVQSSSSHPILQSNTKKLLIRKITSVSYETIPHLVL